MSIMMAIGATLTNGEINRLSDRMAMGLENHYVRTLFEDDQQVFDTLRHLPLDSLVERVESLQCALSERFAAGQLLAMVGDPRINCFDPAMIVIGGGTVTLGLEPEKVSAVVSRYDHVGVRREWIEKEVPAFETDLAPFKIAKYAVTHAAYREFLRDSSYPKLPSSWPFGSYPRHLANHPVYSVSPEAADAYAIWLSRKTGRPFRLPSELEWEFAAAGPDRYEYPWGNEFIEGVANTAELSLFSSTPVGIFPEGASPFGVLDMAGNVEEYTSSTYWVYPNGNLIKDDLYIANKQYRIARGGSFTRFADLARCRRRHGRYAKNIYVMGFRLAESM